MKHSSITEKNKNRRRTRFQ